MTPPHQPTTAVIIGGGPAGLTAAYELLTRTGIVPIVLELDSTLGGISRTTDHRGNKYDLGGHRFFSRSERVMQWWASQLPTSEKEPDPADTAPAFIWRKRSSRIFFLDRLFPYPMTMDVDTMRRLGLRRLIGILFSYLKAFWFPIHPVRSLEDFFINRFGRTLYETFFRDYTEKVWGIPPSRIQPEWGAQRIKGFSITSSVIHAVRLLAKRFRLSAGTATETTLIDRFLYPKHGPGELWEQVGKRIEERGGSIHRRHKVISLRSRDRGITHVTVMDMVTNTTREVASDYVFSTMPVPELVGAISGPIPDSVRTVADGLHFRDFLVVALLTKRLSIGGNNGGTLEDQWIYIQEKKVKVGRLQIFNNWSPYLVSTPDHYWIGAEYFCTEGDELWARADEDLVRFAADELQRIGFFQAGDVVDGTVTRVPKAYPAYWGTYPQLGSVMEYLDGFENLFLIGRNGLHRYNNQDHSMLTAMTAVDNIVNGITTKENIRQVNTEEVYHEEKKRGE